ncbi:hypothetical protein [Halobaculum sp. EA56]
MSDFDPVSASLPVGGDSPAVFVESPAVGGVRPLSGAPATPEVTCR